MLPLLAATDILVQGPFLFIPLPPFHLFIPIVELEEEKYNNEGV